MNLFIFHNDLRLYDNTALSLAIENGLTIPIFITLTSTPASQVALIWIMMVRRQMSARTPGVLVFIPANMAWCYCPNTR